MRFEFSGPLSHKRLAFPYELTKKGAENSKRIVAGLIPPHGSPRQSCVQWRGVLTPRRPCRRSYDRCVRFWTNQGSPIGQECKVRRALPRAARVILYQERRASCSLVSHSAK